MSRPLTVVQLLPALNAGGVERGTLEIAEAQIAAGFRAFVASAGVRAGERDPFVDKVLAEEGLSLGDRLPRTIDDLEDDYFDLIVTLSPQAHHVALDLTRSLAVEVEYWPTPDPTTVAGSRDQIMAAYRDVRDRLKARIARRFGEPGQANP